MKKLFAVCLLAMMSCAGCATVETVTPPSFSFKPDSDFQLSQPDTAQIVRFVSKDGGGKATQDNVTVEVSDIVGQTGESDYSISFEDRGQKYNYSVFPMLLVLKITNNTDHIVTLNNTIIKIEDDKQNDYPMANTVFETKQKAITTIREMFESRDRKYRETFLADVKEKINGTYKAQYDQFSQDVRAKMAKGVEIRFPETPPGKVVTVHGLNENLKNQSPAELYKRMQKDVTEREQTFAKGRNAIMSRITKQIEEKIPNNMKGVITSGVYQPINILPGRSEKVLVPFSKRKEDEIIKKINIGIYDLPTMVNEAGVPTKRAKFNFEMVATQQ